MDYVQAWAEARDAAVELNEVVLALGLMREDCWATARTDGEGQGVVRLTGTPEGIRLLAQALRRVLA